MPPKQKVLSEVEEAFVDKATPILKGKVELRELIMRAKNLEKVKEPFMANVQMTKTSMCNKLMNLKLALEQISKLISAWNDKVEAFTDMKSTVPPEVQVDYKLIEEMYESCVITRQDRVTLSQVEGLVERGQAILNYWKEIFDTMSDSEDDDAEAAISSNQQSRQARGVQQTQSRTTVGASPKNEIQPSATQLSVVQSSVGQSDQSSVVQPDTSQSNQLDTNQMLLQMIQRLTTREAKIDKYNGDIVEYSHFMTQFDAYVAPRASSDAERLLLLKEHCEGKALQAIKGLHIADDMYARAREALKKRFAAPHLAHSELNRKLIAIPQCANESTEEARKFVDQVEEVRCQMEMTGQDTNSPASDMYVCIIAKKLPKWLLSKFYEAESQETGQGLSFDRFCSWMEKKIRGKERAEEMEKMDEPMWRENGSKTGERCPFCGEDHTAKKCNLNDQLKIDMMENKQLCKHCLTNGHDANVCTQKRMCHKCYTQHHKALPCPIRGRSANQTRFSRGPSAGGGSNGGGYNGRRFGNQNQYPRGPFNGEGYNGRARGGGQYSGQGQNGGGQSPGSLNHNMQNARVAQIEVKETEQREKIVIEDEKKTAHEQQKEENIFELVTIGACTNNDAAAVKANVWGPNDGWKKRMMMFDNGASVSFIRNSTATEMGLVPSNEVELRIRTAMSKASAAPNKVRSAKYVLSVQSEWGPDPIRVEVYGVDDLVTPVTYGVEGEEALPEVLIGLDHERKFMDPVLHSVSVPCYFSDERGEGRHSAVGKIYSKRQRAEDTTPNKVEQTKQEGRKTATEIAKSQVALHPPNEQNEDKVHGWCSVVARAQKKGQPKEEVTDDQDQILDRFKLFWELETLNIADGAMTTDEQEAERHFEENVSRNEHGRYVCRLPRLENAPYPDENKSMAMRRLQQTATLIQNKDMRQKCEAIIKEQLATGILEEVKRGKGSHIHYLAHQVVVNEEKQKVRIVFDGSAHLPGARSLNDCLLTGKVPLRSLASILLKWKLGKIVVICDVEKAFHQLELHKEDRDLTRFFWPTESGWQKATRKEQLTWEDVQTLRFARVPFGLNCSPFLLGKAVEKHLRDGDSQLAHEIEQNMYVDNIMICANSEEEALKKAAGIRDIFATACMNVREYTSNNIRVCQEFGDGEAQEKVKMLGLEWYVESDTVEYTMHDYKSKDENLTLRKLASFTAEHFDPLGDYLPAVLRARLMLQKAHIATKPETKLLNGKTEKEKRMKKWDTPLPAEIQEEAWQVFEQCKGTMIVPRRVVASNPESLHWHVFTDASEMAYAAVIFAVPIMGKSRGTPFRVRCRQKLSPAGNSARTTPEKACGVSVAKLELMGIALGAETLAETLKETEWPVGSITLWTDSQIALSWLKAFPVAPGTFVRNCTRRIRALGRGMEWGDKICYVRSADNVADIATRGCPMGDLQTSDLWNRGPRWLDGESCEFPLEKDPVPWHPGPITSPTEANLFAMIREKDKRGEPLVNPLRVGTWEKLIRRTWRCLTFLHKMISRARMKPGTKLEERYGSKSIDRRGRPITWLFSQSDREVLEDDAYGLVMREAQQERLPDDKEMREQTYSINEIGLWTVEAIRFRKQEEKGIIPSIGRIYLPQGRTAELLIRKVHAEHCHSSVGHTMAQIVTKYSIPKVRQFIKSTLYTCLTCRVMRRRLYKKKTMGEHPAERCNMETVPFSNIGIDYLGPLQTKKDGQKKKIWVALFTCLWTRAVHLEMVESLESEAFKNAFVRFTCRRQCPQFILSDNATTFVGAEKDIKDMCSNGLRWKYIRPRAPHEGGVYERLVGVVKGSLKRAVGRMVLQYDHATTLLAQVEATVNCRPLTYCTEAERVLRPIDFLSPNSTIGVPTISEQERKEEEGDPSFEPRAERIDRMFEQRLKALSHFKQIYAKDYLTMLMKRDRETHPTGRGAIDRSPMMGELVFVAEEETPPCEWPVAVVVEEDKGEDGKPRGVWLLSRGRKIRRTVAHSQKKETKGKRIVAESNMSDKNERDGGDDLPFEDPILVDQRRQMFARQYPLPEEEEQHNEHWQKLHTLHLAQQRQTELAVQSMQNDLTQIKEHLEDRYASIKEKIIGEEHERQWTILTKKYSETEAAAIAEALGVRPKSREMEKKEREEKEKREQEKEAAMAILRQPAVANALQMIQEQEPRAGPSNSSTWRGGRGRGTWRRGGHQFRPY